MVQRKKRHLNFLREKKKMAKVINAKRLFIFLDYDGTCTPIVSTPQQAVLPASMRKTIRELTDHYKIGIVSGRSIEDVRSRVDIDNIYYAGSHGFEVVDPLGKSIVNKDAKRVRRILDQVYRKLKERLRNIPGALVEHVKFSISAHYRLVSSHHFPFVKRAVDDVLKQYKSLRKTTGKKVFEIRPKSNWDKGKAVNLILRLLGFDKKRGMVIYIGDDVTDEDAFRITRQKGIGIRVASEHKPTLAHYVVKNPSEVKEVLEFLIDLKRKQRS